MSNFIRFAVRELLAHRVRSVLTLAGIMLGVAAIVSVGAATRGALTSYSRMVDDMSGRADLEVRSRSASGFSPEILPEISSTPGVAMGVPSVTGGTQLLRNGRPNEPILIVGIDPSRDPALRNYHVVGGSFLDGTSDDDVLLTRAFAAERGIGLGRRIEVASRTGTSRLKVVGLIEDIGAGRTGGGAAAFITIGAAQSILGFGDRIEVAEARVASGFRAAAVARELRRRLGDAYSVERPASRTREVEGLMSGLTTALDFFGVIALFVGAFIIYNTFSVGVAQRTRWLGMLRAVGASRPQVLGLVLVEAAVLGSLGSLLGLWLGIGFAGWAVMAVSRVVHTPLGTLSFSAAELLPGLATGVTVALIAAAQPAVIASRTAPVSATRVSRFEGGDWLEKRGFVPGLLLLGTGLVFMFRPVAAELRVTMFQVSALLFLGGTALVLPSILRPLTLIAGGLVALFARTEGRLAERNIMRNRVRTTLTVMTLTVGLMMIVGVEGLNLSYQQAIDRWINTSIGADLFVRSRMPIGMDIGRILRMDLSLKRDIERTAGVSVVAPVAIRKIESAGEQILLVATDEGRFNKISALEVVEGGQARALRRLQRGEGVLISTNLARKRALRAEQTIRLMTARGPEDFKIVGTYVDFSNIKGTVRMHWPLAVKYFEIGDVDSFDIKVAATTSTTAVKKRLERSVARPNGLEVASSKAFKNQARREVRQTFALLDAIVLISIVVAALGIVNTLTINVLERVREIGVLRSIGLTRFQVGRLVVAEGAVVGIIGGLLGAGWGVLVSRIMLEASTADTGFPLGYVFPTMPLLASAAGGVLIAMFSALYPAKKAAGTDIVRSIRYE